jgi:hypothetical protein
MSGWMRDHDIVSPRIRSIFYGYRDALGKLKGIALIGKNTFIEVCTNAALQALAQFARECPDILMVMEEG